MINHSVGAPLVGLILAGGQAKRMGGGDKSLIEAAGETLLSRVARKLARQCETVLLNANGDPARFAAYGLPVVPDVVAGYGGPLVGVLTGLEWLRSHPSKRRWLLTVAADTPLFPEDLGRRLAQATTTGVQLAIAQSGDRTHPTFGLWSVDLADDLRRAVVDHGERRINAWSLGRGAATVPWPMTPYDPFLNVNAPEDVDQLRRILADSAAGEGRR